MSKYKQYLLRKQWADMKVDLITLRGAKCERCEKKTLKLHLHHLSYDRLYNEEPEDLELLCAGCHATDHGIIKFRKSKPIKRDRKAERALYVLMKAKEITVESYVNKLRLIRCR